MTMGSPVSLGWTGALDAFEASLTVLERALDEREWDDLVVAPLPTAGLGALEPEHQVRARALDARWRGLEPRLLDALRAIDAELVQVADTRKAVAGYANAGASFSG